MSVVARMDRVVNEFVARCRWFHEPLTEGRARMFALQHRLNTRQRNSVLKLKVATNCDDWDTRMRILQACSEEVIADHAHGGGRPHWAILEDLGVRIGLRAQPADAGEAAALDPARLERVGRTDGEQALAGGDRRQHLRRAHQRARVRQGRVQAARLVRHGAAAAGASSSG